MNVGRRIYDLRFAKNMTAKDLADRIGVSQSYISLLENNKRRLNLEVLGNIAAVLDTTLAALLSEAPESPDASDPVPSPKRKTGIDLDRLHRSGKLHSMADASGNVDPVPMRLIPVVSKVAAGDPAGYTDGEFPVGFADEFVPAPADIDDPNAFALRVHGDSMSPRFRDGDIVICAPARLPENGDAVVAKIRSEETTCKIFYLHDRNVSLSPVNPSYPAQVYAKEEIDWVYPVVICQRREKR